MTVPSETCDQGIKPIHVAHMSVGSNFGVFSPFLCFQEVQLTSVVLNAFLVWVVVPKLRSMQDWVCHVSQLFNCPELPQKCASGCSGQIKVVFKVSIISVYTSDNTTCTALTAS